MKKEDITGWIAFVLVIAFFGVFVLTILRDHYGASGLGELLYILFNIGAAATGLVLNTLLLEVSHVIGALIGGYEVVSFNIFGLCWKKENGKTRFCFSEFDGLFSETKIVPKENAKKQPNPYPYLLFSLIFAVIEAVVVTTIFSMYKSELGTKGNIAYFLLVVGVVGAIMYIYNILPFKLDSLTDGYRLTKVANPKNREAFNEMLKIDYDISQGKEVETKIFEEVTNYTADINLNKAYAKLNQKDYVEAERILDTIVNSKENVSYNTYIRAKAQKVYIHLINNDLETAQKYYDAEVPVSERREISEDNSMPCIRAYILMSGLLDKSRSECALTISKVGRAYKKTPENRKPVERDLFNEALKKVNEAHPKWELDKYYLE